MFKGTLGVGMYACLFYICLSLCKGRKEWGGGCLSPALGISVVTPCWMTHSKVTPSIVGPGSPIQILILKEYGVISFLNCCKICLHGQQS